MRIEAHLHIRRFLAKESACISVRELPNGKVKYSGTLILKDVTFRVQKAGLEKFRTTGQKNVHAFVRGTVYNPVTDSNESPKFGQWQEAYYNPANTDTFVCKDDGTPVHSASWAIMDKNKVYYKTEEN